MQQELFIRKLYRTSEKTLLNYARPHEIIISYNDDAVHITSRHDLWRVIFDDVKQELVLLHKNTRKPDSKSDNTPVPGFHVQKCEATTLKGMLRNIAVHDEFRDRQQKETMRALKPKEAREARKKEQKRKIRRTLSIIDELRASGQL